jgi:hypothetical protein
MLPARCGLWRFWLDGRADFVASPGHTANEAFVRHRHVIATIIGREPTLNDVVCELLIDDCCAPILAEVAKAYDIDPKALTQNGPKTRQRIEARAAFLLIARARFDADPPFLAKATGWTVDTVRSVLKFADGKTGRKARERVARMGAAA